LVQIGVPDAETLLKPYVAIRAGGYRYPAPTGRATGGNEALDQISVQEER
jgi:hypothetical protein